jgi:GT2 family glycosyltransferase
LSIDVVIPSYNFNEKLIDRIKKIRIPEGIIVKYFIVIDNPKLERPEIDGFVLIQNKENLGAHISRNVGIEAGKGEWILFLDDDIEPEPNLISKYYDIIKENDASGYIGKTSFPDPYNRFTQAVMDSDILTFFPLAETRPSMWWGVTANMIINRKAMGDIRFDKRFPKAGGGEDIDLCLRICKKEDNEFMTVPEAVVSHEWWNQGKFGLKRFGRWAYGDSRLTVLHPELRYYNFPNVAEGMLLGFLGSMLAHYLGHAELWWSLMIPCAILLADIFGEFVKLGLTKRWSLTNAALVTAIRGANDAGRLLGNLSRGRIHGVLERFDYFCTGESIKYERKIAFLKMILHLASVSWVIFFA